MKTYINLLLVLLFSVNAFAQELPETLPEFKIFTLEGNDFTNNDVQKESYSMFIYFNPECGHCKTAFKTLNIKSEQINDANVFLYPVSANTEEKTTYFFEQFSPNILGLEQIDILLDDDFKFADTFLVKGYPAAFLYDKNHKLVKVYDGTSEIMLFLNDIKE